MAYFTVTHLFSAILIKKEKNLRLPHEKLLTIQGCCPVVFWTGKIHHLPATTILLGEQRKSSPPPKSALKGFKISSPHSKPSSGRRKGSSPRARAAECSTKAQPEMPSEHWVDPRALTGRPLLGSQGLNFPILNGSASAHVSSCRTVSRRVFFTPPSSAPPHSWGISRVSRSVTSAFTSTRAP